MIESGVQHQPGVDEEQSPAGTKSLGETSPLARGGRKRRWLGWLGGAVVLLLVAVGAAAEYVARNAEPMLRRKVIANLEERFHSPVELDALHLSLLHGLQVSGTGLRILYLAGPTQPDLHPANAPPMLSVRDFQFRTGLWQLLLPTTRVMTVYVQGMRIDIPPKRQRGALFTGTGGDDQKRRGQPRLGVTVDKIVCTDMTLTIETERPDKPPLVFDIRKLTLTDVGAKKPLEYEASLRNPKPAGDIRAVGHFGPWQNDDPRATPVDGRDWFTNADLGTIRGIGGTLSSTSDFSGTLGRIALRGTTDTPNFSLDVSEHPVALHTDFQATVDGTTGDTTLDQVRATLLHSVLLASGSIVRLKPTESRPAAYPGHDIELTVSTGQARIEDILTLGVKTSPPLMRGALALKTRLSIPPGPGSVSKKMRLQGTFAIRGATFSNPKWQGTVDRMSMRAQGHPGLANAADAALVRSDMQGDFALANAVLHIPNLQYQMPGAEVDLAGDYGLDGRDLEFAGKVRTRATASEMLTGWKSLLAMPFDGLLKKQGAGLEVPIKVSGTKSEPKVGLDFEKLFSHR